MPGAHRECRAVRRSRRLVLAAPALEVADPEMRFRIARRQGDGPLPCGVRGVRLDRFDTNPEQVPRFDVAGSVFDCAPRA